MITHEQYLNAKRIVDQYEAEQMTVCDFDEEDDFDWEEAEEEREEEERAEYAYSCTCGAWAFGKDGRAYHVADCYCGAQ